MQIVFMLAIAVVAFMVALVMLVKPKCKFCLFYRGGYCGHKKGRVSPLSYCQSFQ